MKAFVFLCCVLGGLQCQKSVAQTLKSVPAALELFPAASGTLFGNKNLIMIGELHGTEEVPAFVLQLAKMLLQKGQKVRLGLEFEARSLKNGKGISCEDTAMSDGRSSNAMARLLDSIRALKIPVFGFDVAKEDFIPDSSFTVSSQRREYIMANNIARQYRKDDITLILIGAGHAQPALAGKAEEAILGPGYQSVAAILKKDERLCAALFTLQTGFGGGTAWNYGPGGPGVYPVRPLETGPESRDKVFLKLFAPLPPSGFDGLVYFPEATASKPKYP